MSRGEFTIHDVGLQERYQLLIRGQWRGASDKKTFKTIRPAGGSVLAEYAEATREDVDEMVKAAWKAFKSWKHVTVNERAVILNKIANIIDANQEHLAMVESLGSGKSIRRTMAVDILMPVQHFRYFVGRIVTGEGSANMLGKSTLSLTLRELIGVVGQIVLRNFPFLMTAWRLASVLAYGCCTVFRPSSTMPLDVLEFAKLIQDVLPMGVFNVITDSGSKSGQYMLEHKGSRKLAFTDSTEVGRNVTLATVQRLVSSTLGLGGKSADILFEDYNWEMAMDGLQMGILFNQDQVCCAGSRVFVRESMCNRSVEKTVKRFDQVKVGPPWEANTQIGSQINRAQMERILKYVEVGESEGAGVPRRGQHLEIEGLENGYFLRPTLLGNVTDHTRVTQGEIFGSVACILKFWAEDEVAQMANGNEYGLGGAMWTKDISGTLRVSRAVETGRMWIDTYSAIPEGAPFGGYKASDIERETHKVILEHYTQMKNVMISLSKAPTGFHPVK